MHAHDKIKRMDMDNQSLLDCELYHHLIDCIPSLPGVLRSPCVSGCPGATGSVGGSWLGLDFFSVAAVRPYCSSPMVLASGLLS